MSLWKRLKLAAMSLESLSQRYSSIVAEQAGVCRGGYIAIASEFRKGPLRRHFEIGHLTCSFSVFIKQVKKTLFRGLKFPHHTSNFGAPLTKFSCMLWNFQPLIAKSVVVALDFIEASVYLPCFVPRCFAHDRSRGQSRRRARRRRRRRPYCAWIWPFLLNVIARE